MQGQGVLEGKAVVITGAGQGLGEAYARLAAEHGAKVVVNDVDRGQAERVAADIKRAGGVAGVKLADVSSWADCEALVQYCVSEYGALDGFVNNAALFHMARPAEETEARLRRIFEVNALGTAFCGLAALRQMARQGRGSLINVTSGAQSGIRSMFAYGGTKGAVASMTYAWALDMEGTGVRVNAISPIADTRMSEVRSAFNAEHGIQTASRTAVEAANNAPLVVYLLSDLAAGVTGQVVRVQGNALSLVTHPAALHPGAESEGWTVDKVRQAFDAQLGEQQLPCGVQTSYSVQLQRYATR